MLVVLNGILGKQLADLYIPEILWQFSYYLCYINSTINPVLYALCNASFRRTYVRILVSILQNFFFTSSQTWRQNKLDRLSLKSL